MAQVNRKQAHLECYQEVLQPFLQMHSSFAGRKKLDSPANLGYG